MAPAIRMDLNCKHNLLQGLEIQSDQWCTKTVQSMKKCFIVRRNRI